jgi:hypothetical protein
MVVFSKPCCPNCIRAAARMAALVAAGSRVLEAIAPVYSTVVDKCGRST